jgi:iron(III) transport system permease protein
VLAAYVVWFSVGAGDERPALLRTLGVAGLASLVSIVLGIGYGLALGRWCVPARRLLLALGVAPLVVPPYIAAIAWVDVFGPAGALPRLLGLEIPPGPSLIAEGLVYTTPSAGLLLGSCFFPLVFLAVWAALRRVPPAALEAARLARGPAGERQILVAAVLPHALGAGLVVFALCAVEFAVPQLLRIRVLSESAYLAMAADHKPGVTLLRSLPLMALVALAIGVAAARWQRPPVGGSIALELRTPSARARLALPALCLLALGPGFLLPFASLGLRLVHTPSGTGASGLARAQAILSDAIQSGGGDARRSLEVGLLTAALAVAFSLVLAWPLRRVRPSRAGICAWTLLALTALPAPLIGVGAIEVLNRDSLMFLYDGLGAVVIVCLLRFFPLAFLIVWLALRRIDPAQEDAAVLAGRVPLTGVALPQIAPALVAVGCVVYVLTVTEFGATSLVAPPGQSLLSVFLVNEAHYGQGAELSGLCALLLAIVLAPGVPLAALVGGLRSLRMRRSAP